MQAKSGSNKPKGPGGNTSVQKTGAQRSELARKVKDLMDKFEAQAAKGEVKMTVSDYVRLVQLKNEIDSTERKDVVVTWLEQKPEEQNSEE